MDVRIIQQTEEWEAFLLQQPYSLFVQSFAYGSFFQSLNEQAWVYGVYDGGVLLGGALVLSAHAKRGNFLYIPYGPVVKNQQDFPRVVEALTDHVKEMAKAQGYAFLRVSPFIDDTKKYRQFFSSVGYRKAPMHILAEHTWILDITPSEDDLLRGMKKNHRNLIRRCLKEGVRVEMHTSVQALDQFHRLLDETVKRHRFHRFSREYIEKEFLTFAANNQAAVFHAYLPDGRLDASSIIMFYGSMAVYRHSGSLGLNKHLPASYLLQWEVIKEAKRRRKQWYNFWGIAPKNASEKHPFFGLTHFKTGFGGFEKELLPCQDLPIAFGYWFNWVVETLRSMKRGFKE